MGLYIGEMDRKWLSRVFIIMLADILGILGSYLLALWARFDFHFMDIPPEFLQGYLSTIWWWMLICLAVFWLCKHRLTRAHREKQLKMSCQALHNAPPNRT